MNCCYIAIECRIGYRRTYGIAAIDPEDGEKIILGAMVDVSDDRRTAETLADLCNEKKVPLERFKDTVEDFIG